MLLNSLPKYERISGEKRISRLFSEGTSGFVYPFRYIFLVTGEVGDGSVQQAGLLAKQPLGAGVSVLISVSKRYHRRANKRNLLKRRTREAFRTSKHALKQKAVVAGKHIDIALIYSTKDVLEYDRIESAAIKILAQVAEAV